MDKLASGVVKRARELQAKMPGISKEDLLLRRHVDGRLIGLRVNRYGWWVHWRELGDYYIPRRYKWLVTPNQMSRGLPINQHILDSTGTIAARDCAAGMMTGTCDPTKMWFHLKIGKIDSTKTTPESLWLFAVEQILARIFQESNFYVAMAVMYFDLVVFGTGVLLINQDYENVITCYNPCAGEYYLDSSSKLINDTLYREFTYTVQQTVEEFGLENCSPAIQALYESGGANLTREIVVAHAIEPNTDSRKFGIPEEFKWRECYWEWSGTAAPQGGASYAPGFLRKRGYYECPFIAPRWDITSNDPYGRCPAMDGLGDVKQLQQEMKRKGQAIDKQVNPPMVGDIQMKNQPASLLPGGVTYVSGFQQAGKPAWAPAYTVTPDLKGMLEDLNEVRQRIQNIFFIPLFKTISQFETRSNVTATEIDVRRAEAMVMLGPVLGRINFEGLRLIIERTLAMAKRAGILPPAPSSIQGANIEIKFRSMLEVAQNAAAAAGIERIFALIGSVAGVEPQVSDNVDFDYGVEKISSLLNNDPKLIRSERALQAIRQQRQQQSQEAKIAQGADTAQKLAAGAQTLSQTPVGGSRTALQAMLGQG